MSNTSINSWHGCVLHIAMVKFWQCSNDVGNKPRSWISCLCTQALIITPVLRSSAVSRDTSPKSISGIVLVFDVSPYNLSSDQTRSPSWGIPQQLRFVATVRESVSHIWEEQRVQLTAPLTRGIAQGLVPGGGQRLHCNPEEGESFINTLNLCLHGLEEAMKISLDSF